MKKVVLQNFRTLLAALVVIAMTLPRQVAGQQDPQLAHLMGTVTDVNGDTVGNATVVLQSRDTDGVKTIVTGENGFFEFDQIRPEIRYQISVSSGPALKVALQELCNRAVADENEAAFQTLEDVERAKILATLKQTKWVLSGPNGAAVRLGLNRSTLQFRMKKLGIARPI